MIKTANQPMAIRTRAWTHQSLLAAGSLIACLWYMLADKGLISIMAFPGRIIAVYQLPASGLAAFCLFLIGFYFARARRPATVADSSNGSATPLVIIPFMILACMTIAMRNQTLAGLIFMFGVPLVWTWVLLPQPDRKGNTDPGAGIRKDARLILILFTFFYMLVGLYFTRSAGAHAGDEGHYLIQAHSLFHDGDLDLRNNIKSAGKLDHQRMHISPFSRDNAGYSWHPPGLSFMLALVWPLGIAGHHFMLGLFSGLAMAGTYMLARQMGAGRRDAWMVVMLLGLGTFWGVYSSRALPEVLGAALAVWAYYLCGWQRERPAFAIPGVAACIGSMPWVHTRFLPVALLIMALFCLRIITSPQRSRQRVLQLVMFIGSCGLLLGLYRLTQLQMFTGGQSYAVGDLLFGNLFGMWHVLASKKGILFSLPVFCCLVVAALYRLSKPGPVWLRFEPLLFLLAILITSCATRWYSGGDTLPGRFLLVITPILAANLALMLSSAGSGFRALTIYFGLIPVFIFAGLLAVLPEVRKSFPFAHEALHFHGFFERVPSLFYQNHKDLRLWPALLFYAGAAILFRWAPRKSMSGFGGMTLLVLAISLFARLSRPVPPDVRLTAYQISLIDDRGPVLFFCLGNRSESVRLTDYSNHYGDAMTNQIKSITSDRLASRIEGSRISIPWIEQNDWEGRDYRWATLAPPIKSREERGFLRVSGRASGASPVELAIREGSITHHRAIVKPGDSIDLKLDLQMRKSGDLSVLARIDGASGAFHTDAIAYSAYTPEMLSRAGILLE